jgi:hypothetical protein
MFKASVRKRVSLVIVTVILLSSMLLAGCAPEGYNGVKIIWDFSYLYSKCGPSPEEVPPEDAFKVELLPEWFSNFSFTVGAFINLLLAELIDLNDLESSPCFNGPINMVLFMQDSNGKRVIPNDSTLAFLAGATENTYLSFGPAPKNGEIVRLTLFGYVFDDGRSCVLWSLDGSRNANANEKCGGEVELVCTVRLVEKELKPDCDEGYDWLGFNIAHDSQWLSWAHEFASKNGNK